MAVLPTAGISSLRSSPSEQGVLGDWFGQGFGRCGDLEAAACMLSDEISLERAGIQRVGGLIISDKKHTAYDADDPAREAIALRHAADKAKAAGGKSRTVQVKAGEVVAKLRCGTQYGPLLLGTPATTGLQAPVEHRLCCWLIGLLPQQPQFLLERYFVRQASLPDESSLQPPHNLAVACGEEQCSGCTLLKHSFELPPLGRHADLHEVTPKQRQVSDMGLTTQGDRVLVVLGDDAGTGVEAATAPFAVLALTISPAYQHPPCGATMPPPIRSMPITHTAWRALHRQPKAAPAAQGQPLFAPILLKGPHEEGRSTMVPVQSEHVQTFGHVAFAFLSAAIVTLMD